MHIAGENEMHIGEEGTENLLMNLVVEKQLLKRHIQKDILPYL
jgi:hypothetical protein